MQHRMLLPEVAALCDRAQIVGCFAHDKVAYYTQGHAGNWQIEMLCMCYSAPWSDTVCPGMTV